MRAIDFADDRGRQAQVLDDHERELPGSPCALVAFEDGLARFIVSVTNRSPRFCFGVWF